MSDITLQSLIKEQEGRVRTLQDRVVGYDVSDYYPDVQAYYDWVELTQRFLDLHFKGDKYIEKFCKLSNESFSLTQQRKLLSILKAFDALPIIIHNQNNNKMEKLKYEIELLIPKCKQILTLRDEYKKLEENIKELDNEYLIQKDNKVLFEKSDRIEELYEQLQQKEEQFNFVQSLKESFNPKKRFATIFSSFKKYYKYKKQVAREELDEYISLFEVGYSYYKQYHKN